jgi:hypothetical protein
LPVLLAAFTYPFGAQAQSTIHEYADAAACQMGGRLPNYLPFGILPGGNRVPIKWNEMEVVWTPSNLATGTGEFMVNTPGGLKPIGMQPDDPTKVLPEKNAMGPITDPTKTGGAAAGQLKCDHFSYVEASCTPDQYVREIFQGSCTDTGNVCSAATQAQANLQCAPSTCAGMARWHVIFRRTAASAKTIANNTLKPPADSAVEPADWDTGIYTSYYKVVDANGFKLDTYGTVWLDGLGPTAAAKNFTNGFRSGPMPRPGGKRPTERLEGRRATDWYDEPATMKAGTCNGCHGTPFNGSDWIAQSKLKFKNDEDLPWWHAGNEKIMFPDKVFFEKAMEGADTFDCKGCHQRWLMNAGSTPGGERNSLGGFQFARFMTMVHDADAANPFFSPYVNFASRFRTDADQAVFLDKNATQTHWMPPDHGLMTITDWNTSFQKRYDRLACCGAGLAGLAMQPPNTGDEVFNCSMVSCTTKVSQKQVTALFQTPWMTANGKAPGLLDPADQPNGTQLIASPDAASGASLTLAPCPAGIVPTDPADRCFRLAWSDPDGSPFNAPQTFHYNQLANKKVSDPDWTDAEKKSTEYCGDKVLATITTDPSAVFDKAKESPLPADATGDTWRFSYETFGLLKKCEKMAIRLCGGWCPQKIRLPDEGEFPTRTSTGLGQLLTVANDTLGDFSNQISVRRGGFRKNLTTGRFVQTVTLTNTGQVAVPSPISLVLKNLSANATLFNQSGTVGAPAAPYVSVTANGDSLKLNPGESVAVVLEFTNPTNQAITYMTQTLALSVSADCN